MMMSKRQVYDFLCQTRGRDVTSEEVDEYWDGPDCLVVDQALDDTQNYWPDDPTEALRLRGVIEVGDTAPDEDMRYICIQCTTADLMSDQVVPANIQGQDYYRCHTCAAQPQSPRQMWEVPQGPTPTEPAAQVPTNDSSHPQPEAATEESAAGQEESVTG